MLCSRPRDPADSLPTVIESPVFSGGVQIGLLKLTVTLSVVDTEAAVQQAMDANAEMAFAPIDPTAQLPSGLSDVADTARRLDFGGVLARLDGFMKVADLAAEVCRCYSAAHPPLNYLIYSFNAGSPIGQIGVGSSIGSIQCEDSK